MKRMRRMSKLGLQQYMRQFVIKTVQAEVSRKLTEVNLAAMGLSPSLPSEIICYRVCLLMWHDANSVGGAVAVEVIPGSVVDRTVAVSPDSVPPGPVLQDIGFIILPELGKEKFYISETFFCVMFFSFILGSENATMSPPKNVLKVLLINFPRGVVYGCGDLIFSSHMIFTLVFVRTYNKYGSKRFIKTLAWLMAITQSLLIIASHKHYSVDVVVAWYTVNLVVFFIDKKLPEMPDRTSSSGSLLPLSTKETDKRKEEHNKLLNDTADWRQRTQVNGKHQDNGSHFYIEEH
ncbi:uncharacterized protein A4U43_C05F2650 [Asparagus officinalis]|uniref:Sphingomyelin synthase-like domain-containing protein n=1 Tax=Asparagus officinalis TaxID=4686 RepID=A0A5P1EPV7_ASPOF|nr:uncharacterized protein A4U43_C05F2650 [Asparagus officinalis]